MRRIPLNSVTEALYKLLSESQDVPVYDDLPTYDVILPIITLGDFTSKPTSSKDDTVTEITMTIDIWSNYEGRKEINGIINDIIAILSNYDLELTDGFSEISQEVDFVNTFSEDDDGYHGVISLVSLVQELQQ